MIHKRADRVADLLRGELSEIIRDKIRDPRVGFVTITGVDVSDDLKHAKVYVSVLGTDKEKEESLNGLNSAVGFIRGQLGARVRLRYIPEILFRYDSSIEYGSKMDKLLSELPTGGS